MYHNSVLCDEVVELAQSVPHISLCVDGTVGDGGHALALLSRNPSVSLIAIDCDEEMLVRAQARLRAYHSRVRYVHEHYDAYLTQYRGEKAQFILFDLGVSMTHIKESGRGFTFAQDEALDMRFNRTQHLRAEHIVNSYRADELRQLFTQYGDEWHATRIVRALCEQRKKSPIRSTAELVRIVSAALPKRARGGGRNPATKVFQALRIAVNDEMERLRRALPSALAALDNGGILATISFHSGEDRIIKHYFRELAEQNVVDLIFKKVVTPRVDEIARNRAARSAKLRAIRKRSQ